MTITSDEVGTLLRQWRQQRGRSQLDVSIAADVSTRHLSWVETGRSRPSRDMIERLCEELEVPLRERNAVYLAAGLAPRYPETSLTDLGAIRGAVEALLAGHEPYPSVAVNVQWDLLAANSAMKQFLAAVPEGLRGTPLNMLRITLHPDGLADQLVNPRGWREHTLRRVRRQLARTRNPALAALLAELESYPVVGDACEEPPRPTDEVAFPMRLRSDFGELSLLYAVTVFGSPRDVSLDEIAIETFVPADEATRVALAGS